MFEAHYVGNLLDYLLFFVLLYYFRNPASDWL